MCLQLGRSQVCGGGKVSPCENSPEIACMRTVFISGQQHCGAWVSCVKLFLSETTYIIGAPMKGSQSKLTGYLHFKRRAICYQI